MDKKFKLTKSIFIALVACLSLMTTAAFADAEPAEAEIPEIDAVEVVEAEALQEETAAVEATEDEATEADAANAAEDEETAEAESVASSYEDLNRQARNRYLLTGGIAVGVCALLYAGMKIYLHVKKTNRRKKNSKKASKKN